MCKRGIPSGGLQTCLMLPELFHRCKRVIYTHCRSRAVFVLKQQFSPFRRVVRLSVSIHFAGLSGLRFPGRESPSRCKRQGRQRGVSRSHFSAWEILGNIQVVPQLSSNQWIYTFCRLFCARTLTKFRQPNNLYLSISQYSNGLNLWWPADDPSIWIDLAVLDWLDCFGRCIVVLTQCFCVSRVWGGWWRSFTHGQMKQIQRSKRCHIPSSLVQFRSKTTRTNRSFKSF